MCPHQRHLLPNRSGVRGIRVMLHGRMLRYLDEVARAGVDP